MFSKHSNGFNLVKLHHMSEKGTQNRNWSICFNYCVICNAVLFVFADPGEPN